MLGKLKLWYFQGGGGGAEIRKMPKFNFNEETVDVVWDYKYLGVKFNYNSKFKKGTAVTVFICKQGCVFIVKEMSAA